MNEILSADYINKLRNIDSPTISTAIEAFKVRDDTDGYATSELKCLIPDLKPMVGYAITATVDSASPAPVNNKTISEKFNQILDMVYSFDGPTVVVYKNVGPQKLKSCLVGDMVASGLSKLGASGIVTDCCIRDLAGIKKNTDDFQIFAAGLVVSHGIPNIYELNNIVEICGLIIKPGDLLHGDESGLVKIPVDKIDIDSLIDKAQTIINHEKKYFDFIKSDSFTYDDLKKFYKPNPAAE